MSVTLRDCLALGPLDKAEVVAGNDYLNAAVKTVSVLESSKESYIKQFAVGDEQLMLATFADIKDDEAAQKKAIKALAAAGNVGLILYHGDKTLPKVSEEVIETAEDVGLPLIVLPGDEIRTGDLIREITEGILWGDTEKRGDDLINNTIYHLLNFEKYSSFPAAIKGAALANDFQVILLSENFNPIFQVETRYRTTIDEAIKLGKERAVDKQDQVYTLINVNGVITYWGPVTIQGERYFMFIVDNEDLYTAAEITKLAEIIELAMGMWKYTPQRDVRTEFIQALRRGNASLARSLQDEVGIDPDEIISTFFAVEHEKEGAKKLTRALDSIKSLNTIYLSEGDQTYGIVLADEDDKDAASECIRVYDSFKGKSGLTLHHMTGPRGLEGAADAFALIGETGPFAKSIFPYKSVFTKYEMALISNCLHLQLQGGTVRKNYLDFFEPFNRLGDLKRSQLMETLETFVLDAGMNNAKTAGYMDIHANTVQYRLRKIDDLMGAEITGNRVIPGLTMALALLRLERVVNQ